MAWAGIPPAGAMHQAEIHQAKLIREQTTADPVERWRLREERLSAEFGEASAGAVKQARQIGRAYAQKQLSYERSENNKYKPLPAGAKIIKGD